MAADHRSRAAAAPSSDPRLARMDRLSYWLDNSIRIPGIGYRIGYDALIGLIPGVGDAAGLLLSSYIVLEAAMLRIPAPILLRMAANVGIEVVVGAIPLLGDLFDATWKANARNMALIRRELGVDVKQRRRRGRGFVIGIAILLVLLLIAVAAGALYLLQTLASAAGL